MIYHRALSVVPTTVVSVQSRRYAVGVGVAKPNFSVPLFAHFSPLSRHCLSSIKYHNIDRCHPETDALTHVKYECDSEALAYFLTKPGVSSDHMVNTGSVNGTIHNCMGLAVPYHCATCDKYNSVTACYQKSGIPSQAQQE